MLFATLGKGLIDAVTGKVESGQKKDGLRLSDSPETSLLVIRDGLL